MIDFHNHILPNVDDGSKSIEMSMDMIRKASEDGTKTIINTSHFQHPRIKSCKINSMINQKKLLEEEIKKNKINVEIIQGMEVYYDLNLDEILEEDFTLIGEKYMLIEFDPFILPRTVDEMFFKLQAKGVCPIIAHPERYHAIQNHLDIAKNWKNKDYILQINASSILGHFGQRCQDTSIKLIENSMCDLIGSDAHNNSSRNFCLKDALNFLESKFKENNSELFNHNANKLIIGEELQKIVFSKKNKFWFF